MVASGISFLAAVAAATHLSKEAFGVCASAFLVYAILIAGAQAVIGEPLVLTEADDASTLRHCREAIAFAFVVGSACGVVVVLGALAIPDIRGGLLPLAVALPILFAKEAMRFGASLRRSMHVAFASDVAWLLGGVVAYVSVRAADVQLTPTLFIVIWAAPGVIVALALVPVFGGPGGWRVDLSRYWRRDYLGYRFVWEWIFLRATAQFLTLLLGALGGLAATGAVRATTTLFGPLVAVVLAVSAFAIPVLRGVDANKRDRALLFLAAGLVGLACLGALALHLVPDAAGAKLLGDTWVGARQMVAPVGAQIACTAVATVYFTAIRMVKPEATLALRTGAAAIIVPSFFAGYAVDGVLGAVWALTLAAFAQAATGVVGYQWLRSRGNGLSALGVVPDGTVKR